MTTRTAFDVAIVGAGAAGCVLADRLTAAGDRSVILVEAGSDPGIEPPATLRNAWSITRELDWGDRSEPDEGDDGAPVRRARALGGTSWVTRFALRGGPADFDEWAALGNVGWGWADVLPTFRAIEADAEFGDRPWHGSAGRIPVTRYPDLEPTPVHAAAIRAAESAGFAPIEDHNAPGALGVGPMPMSSRNGVRVTTATAYLGDRESRANLEIRTAAAAASITVAGRRVTGLRLADGTRIQADLVVVAAGAIGSPALLLRSGIGPAAELRAAGIAVTADLQGVGANLADHPATDLDTRYGGPARTAPILHSVATFRSRAADAGGPPDLLLWLTDPGPPDSPPQLAIEIVLLKTRSRGRVRLRSADPADPPRITLPGLRDPDDLARLAEAYERALDVVAQPALRPYRSPSTGRRPRGPRARAARVLAGRYDLPHFVGTCAMGPSPAAGAVVAPDGRVHGLDGLVVADASVMPSVPSGFTHLPTIMVAERLAAAILGRG